MERDFQIFFLCDIFSLLSDFVTFLSLLLLLHTNHCSVIKSMKKLVCPSFDIF